MFDAAVARAELNIENFFGMAANKTTFYMFIMVK